MSSPLSLGEDAVAGGSGKQAGSADGAGEVGCSDAADSVWVFL